MPNLSSLPTTTRPVFTAIGVHADTKHDRAEEGSEAKNLGRHNILIEYDDTHVTKYVATKRSALEQCRAGNLVLDAIRPLLPYVQGRLTCSMDPVQIVNRHGDDAIGYWVKGERMTTLDQEARDVVVSTAPFLSQSERDLVDALRTADEEGVFWPTNVITMTTTESRYLDGYGIWRETPLVAQLQVVKSAEMCVVRMDRDRLRSLYDNPPTGLQEFRRIGGTQYFIIDRETRVDFTILHAFFDQKDAGEVVDAIYAEQGEESAVSPYYRPRGDLLQRHRAPILLSAKMVHIPLLGLSGRVGDHLFSTLPYGAYTVVEQDDRYVTIEDVNGVKTNVDLSTISWRRRRIVDTGLPKQSAYYVKKDWSEVYMRFDYERDRMRSSYSGSKHFRETLIDELARRVPPLNDGWHDRVRTFVKHVHSGRMAFTAACLARADRYSFDWKLENWGLRRMDAPLSIVVSLAGLPVPIEVDAMGICLIDHEYVERELVLSTETVYQRWDEMSAQNLTRYSHHLYSDGAEYISTREDAPNDVVVNPHLLPRDIVQSRVYPHVLKFEELSKHTGGPLTLEESFARLVDDLRAKGWAH